MNKAEYSEYLLTDDWKLKRMYAFAYHGKGCVCTRRATQVHHLSYDNLGQEKMSDLLPLCNNCHENYHTVEGKRKIADKRNNKPEVWDGAETEARKKVVLADYYAAFPTPGQSLGGGDE